MRAVTLSEFGPPSVLQAADCPAPEPADGEVLISVEFANITFVETQFRATGFGPFKAELPMIPGNGVGGSVQAVGDGVADDLVGRRVVASTGGKGGYAELVTVPVEALIDVPAELGMDVAVALLADGRTALMLADAVGLREGDRVIVEAAAGGVGSLLVQLAKAAGCVVIAAVGGSRKVEVASGFGADVVVDYLDPNWPSTVRDAVSRVTVVFDGVGGDIARAAFELLDRNGRMLTFGGASGDWTKISADEASERGVELVSTPRLPPDQLRSLSTRAFAEAAVGRLHPVIGQRFPLERAADAHAAMENRTTVGKTLLEI